MKLVSLKFLEGNNIKRRKKIIKIEINHSSKDQVERYAETYINISSKLGFSEKIMDVSAFDDCFLLWMTYSDEEVARYLLMNISSGEFHQDQLLKAAQTLVKTGLVIQVVKAAYKRSIPVITLTQHMFQIGYGKNSIILGNGYESFEKPQVVAMTSDLKIVWEMLRYNHIPRAQGKVLYSTDDEFINSVGFPVTLRSIDKKVDVVIHEHDRQELKRVLSNMLKMYTRTFACNGITDYRLICFNGKVRLAYKVRHHETGNIRRSFRRVEPTDEMKGACLQMFKTVPLKFMCVDLCGEGELKAVDVNEVFRMEDDMKEIQEEVVNAFLDGMAEEGIGLIPIISVTGTNGKTTTARLIHHLLNEMGYFSALTSTGGIFIGEEKLKSGDTTGYLSARDVLMNNTVEAAVFETARGGISRNGLGYDMARAAVITSLSEDHIGMNGIRNVNDLAKVKSIILDELDQGGKIVVKAQKELVQLVEGRENVCLFGEARNEYIDSFINMGKEVLYMEDECIVEWKDGKERRLVSVKELPFTHGGKSVSNTLNIMAAMAAVSSLCENQEIILNALKKFQCDLGNNPGRQNILDFGRFKVILDYGHNSEAFHEVFRIARALEPSRLTGIIAAAGDRMDKYISELGEISAAYCDRIIIREQHDLRGRKPGESAALIKIGIQRRGFDESHIETIYKEEEAIASAMKNAVEGEVIVLFTQCLDVIMPVINEYLDSQGMNRMGEGIDFSH